MKYSLRKIMVLTVALFIFPASNALAATKFESFLWKSAAAASLSLLALTNAAKADGVTVELGEDGDGDFRVGRLGLQWDWNENLYELSGWKLSSYWQLEFAKWQSNSNPTQEAANVTAGIIPMFHFLGKPGFMQPYVDVGVGITLFTDSKLAGHEFGSNFQFTDILGAGFNVGARNQWGIGYKFQHYSNGSVRPPNSGINFHQLTLTYHY